MNRKELFHYADGLSNKPEAVHAILTGIRESSIQAESARSRLKLLINLIDDNGLDGNFQDVSGLMDAALNYERTAAKRQTLFVTLADALQQMGHALDY